MKPEEKKHYEAPAVTRVRLTVKESILAVCNSSPDNTPKEGEFTCGTIPGCMYPRT